MPLPPDQASAQPVEPAPSTATGEVAWDSGEAWARAERQLLAKLIAEFAYEGILNPQPEPGQPGTYRLPVDDRLTLRFTARRCAYGHWKLPADSLTPDTGVLNFLARAHSSLLDLPGDTTGHLIRELTATLNADVRQQASALSAADLAELDYARLEGHMTGHPWLVANKGRLGFSHADAARWAPEARTPRRLPWLAVHNRLASYRGTAALADPHRLYERELGTDTRDTFEHTLRAKGLEPADYLYLPVHPWQWNEIVAPLFAAALARHEIVPLPTDTDRDLRLPQQSIRTFLNVSDTGRHTVKLPLAIFNTLVWRGLPTERTLAAPAVTAWMHRLREHDRFLREECRVILLGEVASVSVPHSLYDALPHVPYQYRELLGSIWREPLTAWLDGGEHARTLASLIHTDPHGRSLTAELVHRSGLAPRTWLRQLFGALLPPLLHFLYRYGTVFSPHGENAIVVFDEQEVPIRLAVKDFVDDVNISADPVPELAELPTEVRSVLLTEEPEALVQFIHSGLFVGVFRYLAPLCHDELDVPEEEFWSLVRTEIDRYHDRFPELKDRFRTFDLLTERIDRLCLNRNRLYRDGYRDRPERPHAVVNGTVRNPLHRP